MAKFGREQQIACKSHSPWVGMKSTSTPGSFTWCSRSFQGFPPRKAFGVLAICRPHPDLVGGKFEASCRRQFITRLSPCDIHATAAGPAASPTAPIHYSMPYNRNERPCPETADRWHSQHNSSWKIMRSPNKTGAFTCGSRFFRGFPP